MGPMSAPCTAHAFVRNSPAHPAGLHDRWAPCTFEATSCTVACRLAQQLATAHDSLLVHARGGQARTSAHQLGKHACSPARNTLLRECGWAACPSHWPQAAGGRRQHSKAAWWRVWDPPPLSSLLHCSSGSSAPSP